MKWKVFHGDWPYWPRDQVDLWPCSSSTVFGLSLSLLQKLCKWQLTLYTKLWISLCYILPFTKRNIPFLRWHATSILLSCLSCFLIYPKFYFRPTRELAPPSESEQPSEDCGVMCTFIKELLEGHLKVSGVMEWCPVHIVHLHQRTFQVKCWSWSWWCGAQWVHFFQIFLLGREGPHWWCSR